MGYSENGNVRRRWEEVSRTVSRRPYASLNRKGHISISGWTHEQMGSPGRYVILFDRRSQAIGLRPAREGEERKAFLAGKESGQSKNNRLIRAGAFCASAGITPERTIVFTGCTIDRDGVLVLDLSDERTRPSRRQEKAECGSR